MKHAGAILFGGAAGLAGLLFVVGRRRTSSPVAAEPANGFQLVGDVSTMKPWALSQVDVVQAVKDGRAEYSFVPLPGAAGVYVTTDAVKVDGVRVPVSARTTQAVCDHLGVSPTTSLVEDMIHDAAGTVVVPPTADASIMQTDGAVRGFSASIDKQIYEAGFRNVSGIVSSVGKSWILDNAELNVPGRPVNYGLFRPDGPVKSVTGKFRLWQDPGWAHANPDHWDYSQTLRLVRLDPGAALPSLTRLQVTRLWV